MSVNTHLGEWFEAKDAPKIDANSEVIETPGLKKIAIAIAQITLSICERKTRLMIGFLKPWFASWSAQDFGGDVAHHAGNQPFLRSLLTHPKWFDQCRTSLTNETCIHAAEDDFKNLPRGELMVIMGHRLKLLMKS